MPDHICLALTSKHFSRVSALVDLKYGFIYQKYSAPGWFNCLDSEDLKTYQYNGMRQNKSLYNDRTLIFPRSELDVHRRAVHELKCRLGDWMPKNLALCGGCWIYRSKKRSDWQKTARCSYYKIDKWSKGQSEQCPECMGGTRKTTA